MSSKKKCFVPSCYNNVEGTPEKVFFSVPTPYETRKLWFDAVDLEYCEKSTRYCCCEDHFNLEDDMENFMRFKLTYCQPRLKKTVVPHKFLTHPLPDFDTSQISPTSKRRQKAFIQGKSLEMDEDDSEAADGSSRSDQVMLGRKGIENSARSTRDYRFGKKKKKLLSKRGRKRPNILKPWRTKKVVLKGVNDEDKNKENSFEDQMKIEVDIEETKIVAMDIKDESTSIPSHIKEADFDCAEFQIKQETDLPECAKESDYKTMSTGITDLNAQEFPRDKESEPSTFCAPILINYLLDIAAPQPQDCKEREVECNTLRNQESDSLTEEASNGNIQIKTEVDIEETNVIIVVEEPTRIPSNVKEVDFDCLDYVTENDYKNIPHATTVLNAHKFPKEKESNPPTFCRPILLNSLLNIAVARTQGHKDRIKDECSILRSQECGALREEECNGNVEIITDPEEEFMEVESATSEKDVETELKTNNQSTLNPTSSRNKLTAPLTSRVVEQPGLSKSNFSMTPVSISEVVERLNKLQKQNLEFTLMQNESKRLLEQMQLEKVALQKKLDKQSLELILMQSNHKLQLQEVQLEKELLELKLVRLKNLHDLEVSHLKVRLGLLDDK